VREDSGPAYESHRPTSLDYNTLEEGRDIGLRSNRHAAKGSLTDEKHRYPSQREEDRTVETGVDRGIERMNGDAARSESDDRDSENNLNDSD